MVILTWGDRMQSRDVKDCENNRNELSCGYRCKSLWPPRPAAWAEDLRAGAFGANSQDYGVAASNRRADWNARGNTLKMSQLSAQATTRAGFQVKSVRNVSDTAHMR